MMNVQASILETFPLAMLKTLLHPDEDCFSRFCQVKILVEKENLMSVEQIRLAQDTMCK